MKPCQPQRECCGCFFDGPRIAGLDEGATAKFRLLRIGAEIIVVADAASVGSDAGSIRHDATVISAPILRRAAGTSLPNVDESLRDSKIGSPMFWGESSLESK